MNVLIVHAHPEPRSFNGALTRTAVRALREQGQLLPGVWPQSGFQHRNCG